MATDLRIRPQYLVAIEEGRFGDLPGPTYVTAFLRSYAGYVGFNPEDIVAAYRHFDAKGEVARPEYNFPLVESERRLPRGAMVLLSVLLLAGAYTAWNFMGRQDVAPPPPVAELPKELRAPAAPAGDAAAAPSQQRTGADTPAAATEPARPAAAQSDVQTGSTQVEAPPAAATPALPPPAARATPQSPAPQSPAPPAASSPPPAAPAAALPARPNATPPAPTAAPPAAVRLAEPPPAGRPAWARAAARARAPRARRNRFTGVAEANGPPLSRACGPFFW